MPTSREALRARVRAVLVPTPGARARRRRAISVFLARWLPFLRCMILSNSEIHTFITKYRLCLFVVGYLWMLALPSPRLGRTTYIDENALQPDQVNTYWNWADVHRADLYLGDLEKLRDTNASSAERADFLRIEFEKLGLPAASQSYSIRTTSGEISGVNAYSVLSAPRASGTEAMIISASWLSRTGDGDGTLNLRGVASVLALASFLKRYSLWSKDIIFVVSDGYLDGMHAWLSKYHGVTQENLHAESLSRTSGVVWTALNIDYPGHSFSHLGIFHEGLDGLLPNQDLLNSFRIISSRTGGCPVVLYDHLDLRQGRAYAASDIINTTWLPSFVKENGEVQEYAVRASNVLRHVSYQAMGRPSGVHGLFRRYRIDAITLFAVPAEGPHGFHAIGRIVESTLRTMNNLLERLHASFFFYILTSPGTFLKIGHYLPSAVLVSVALMFGGLAEWVRAGWRQVQREEGGKDLEGSDSVVLAPTWERRNRPVLRAIAAMLGTHVLGLLVFISVPFGYEQIIVGSVGSKLSAIVWRGANIFALLYAAFWAMLFALSAVGVTETNNAPSDASVGVVVKALNLCLASTVISVTSVLNFALAALLAILLGVPLTMASGRGSRQWRGMKNAAYVMLTSGSLVYMVTPTAVRDWEALGVWFMPFVCTVYIPLMLQAAVVCVLQS